MQWVAHFDGGLRRVNHAAVAFDDSQIYSFGGYCSGEDFETKRPIDVHVLNTSTYRWRSLSTPQCSEPPSQEAEEGTEMKPPKETGIPYQRYGHSAVPYKGKAYIWGGRNDSDGASNVLHEYDPQKNSWRIVDNESQIKPAARDGHSACVIGDMMLVFGGFEEDFQRFSQETFAFDFSCNEWKELKTKGTPPSWRDFHTATAIDNKMYIFGGRSDVNGQFHSNREVYNNRLMYLDVNDKTWYTPDFTGSPPCGRRSHSSWAYNGRLYIFGGYSGKKDRHFDSLHEFNPDRNVWTLLSVYGNGPQARRRHCSIVCGSRVYVFGGTSPAQGNMAAIVSSAFMQERALVDLSDLIVLDYAPSLQTLCHLCVIKHKLHVKCGDKLPWDIKRDLDFSMQTNMEIGPVIRENELCG